MTPTFEQFWKWLQEIEGLGGCLIKNLGGRGKFKINVSGNEGTCTPQSKGNCHPFTKDHAKQVWERFRKLPIDEKLMAGRYVDGERAHNFNPCPNRYCSPWIAAAIRHFLISRI
jgi:hypothetical protein